VLAVPGLPAALPGLVRACMAKNPDDRPKSAAVALALWDVLAGHHRGALAALSRS
jgi:serine/threonine-protein kinase